MSDVIVRLTVNKMTGKYDARVVRHEGGSCSDGVDESILSDLLNAEVPGYGEIVKEEDSGHTCEYFEAKRKKQNPNAYHEIDTDDGDESDKGNKGKKVDLGYGV